MIAQERAVMEQALEALEAMKAEFRAYDLPYGSKAYTQGNEASHILRAALAEPAQEPVGEMRLSGIIEGLVVPVVPAELPVGTKLYAAPPQRPLLTDGEIAQEVYRKWGVRPWANIAEFARAIERRVRGE